MLNVTRPSHFMLGWVFVALFLSASAPPSRWGLLISHLLDPFCVWSTAVAGIPALDTQSHLYRFTTLAAAQLISARVRCCSDKRTSDGCLLWRFSHDPRRDVAEEEIPPGQVPVRAADCGWGCSVPLQTQQQLSRRR